MSPARIRLCYVRPGRSTSTSVRRVPMSDGVLRVPGFFGFASFGRGAAKISYFDHAAHAIQAARPDLKGWIATSQPPPTGSLKARAQNLHDTICDVFEKGIGGDDRRKPDR